MVLDLEVGMVLGARTGQFCKALTSQQGMLCGLQNGALLHCMVGGLTSLTRAWGGLIWLGMILALLHRLCHGRCK